MDGPVDLYGACQGTTHCAERRSSPNFSRGYGHPTPGLVDTPVPSLVAVTNCNLVPCLGFELRTAFSNCTWKSISASH